MTSSFFGPSYTHPFPLSSCHLFTYHHPPYDDVVYVQDIPENVWDMNKLRKEEGKLEFLTFKIGMNVGVAVGRCSGGDWQLFPSLFMRFS